MFSIEIRFDQIEENVSAGAELSGIVSITAREASECWKVELLWNQQPESDAVSSATATQMVILARLVSWEAGQKRDFPFTFVPREESVEGTSSQLWFVRTALDVRRANKTVLTEWQMVDVLSPPAALRMEAPADLSPMVGLPHSQAEMLPSRESTAADAVMIGSPSPEQEQPGQTGDAEGLGAHFEIKFSRADRKYNRGESVTGVLVVQAERDIQLRRLALHREWRSHGRTARRSGGAGEVQLAEGVSWEPGKRYEYLFSFRAPDGPATVRGRSHGLDWYVWPELEFEGQAAGPAVERAAQDAAEAFLLAPVGPLAVRQLAARQSQSWIVIGSSFFISLVGLLGIVALWGANRIQMDVYISLLGVALLFAIGWSVREAYRYKMAELYLGAVRVEISDHESESSILTEIQFEPRRPVWVEKMDVRLLVGQLVTVRQGGRTVTQRHAVFKKETGKRLERSLRAGLQFRYQAFIEEIPENIPASGISGDEEIVWRVQVLIGIQRWLAWERDFPIRVTRS